MNRSQKPFDFPEPPCRTCLAHIDPFVVEVGFLSYRPREKPAQLGELGVDLVTLDQVPEECCGLFGDLIKSNKIDPKFSELRRLLSRAVAEKSDFDYKGVDVSQASAARWLREIEGFLRAVHKILGK